MLSSKYRGPNLVFKVHNGWAEQHIYHSNVSHSPVTYSLYHRPVGLLTVSEHLHSFLLMLLVLPVFLSEWILFYVPA